MPTDDALHGMATGDWGVREPAQGDLLGGLYELTQSIGQGGMGVVWRARDLHVASRYVAIKFLPAELRYHVEAIEQMKASFEKIHPLTHQHIGKAFGLHEDARLGPYVLMDLVEGESLRKYATTYRKAHGAISVEHAVALLRPIASALDYAHGESVVHRDVKPENILVRTSPRLWPTLIDFGLAAAVRTTMRSVSRQSFGAPGTLSYMSSEQLRGKRPPAVDQYALAVVAYELLANSLPLDSDTNDGLIYEIHHGSPEPITGVDGHVNDALLRGLSKKPEDRFHSCQELIEALGRHSPPVSSPPVVRPMPSPSAPSLTVPRQSQTWLVAPFDAQAAAAGQVACARELGVPVEFTNTIGMRFRLIPPGEFSMGGNEFDDEKPIHRVKLTQPFYLGVFPVTQGEYERVMGVNPSYFKGDPRLPVENVSWNDADYFLRSLTAKELNHTYSLPTESQWEYACRAGTTTAFWFGDSLNGDRANMDGTCPYGTDNKGLYLRKTTPVGAFAANPFGLHDMHGNVWEWCQDWYGSYPAGDVTDPAGKPDGSTRVDRGGGWDTEAVGCRVALRDQSEPQNGRSNLGFRVALNFVRR